MTFTTENLKTFTTHRKRKTTINISRKGSVVKEKCRQLTEQVKHHFSNGIIDDSDLTLMIEDLCGADKTTVRAYKGYSGHIRQGRCGDNHVVGLSHNGYLERFGFMRKIPGRKWRICQIKLLTEDMSIRNEFKEKISISPSVVDVVKETKEKPLEDFGNIELEEEEDTEKERNFLHESMELTPREIAVFTAVPCEEPDRSKTNWGRQAPITPEPEEVS